MDSLPPEVLGCEILDRIARPCQVRARVALRRVCKLFYALTPAPVAPGDRAFPRAYVKEALNLGDQCAWLSWRIAKKAGESDLLFLRELLQLIERGDIQMCIRVEACYPVSELDLSALFHRGFQVEETEGDAFLLLQHYVDHGRISFATAGKAFIDAIRADHLGLVRAFVRTWPLHAIRYFGRNLAGALQPVQPVLNLLALSPRCFRFLLDFRPMRYLVNEYLHRKNESIITTLFA